MEKLNKKLPYSEISGHSVAKFYQLGRYFNGAGIEVSAKEAAKPAGMTNRELEELRKEGLEADESVSGEDPEPEEDEHPEVPEAPEPENAAEPEPEEGNDETEFQSSEDWQRNFDDSMKLHPKAVKAMAEQLKETMIKDGVETEETLSDIPYTGEGSKEKNATWIADKTSD